MTGPILIDGRAAARRQTGGVERWAGELATRLPALFDGEYVVASPPRGMKHRLGHPWEQFVLPLKAIRASSPLILCPANLAPFASRRTVVVIHDAAPLRFPADYSRGYVAWQRFLLPRIVRNARCVITPSQFSRGELIDTCAADPERIRVVAPGVGEEFSVTADSVRARSVHGLSKPYVLLVASRIGRKNISVLDQAARALASVGHELVSVGGARPEMNDGRASGLVRSLGQVDGVHLPGIYAGASALVLPSVYEGYGLPVIEAMASGVPVVCSTAGALPEAAGGAAVLVDPRDAEGFADALVKILSEPDLRSEMVAKGLARTAGLTWRETAANVNSICRDLASGL